MTPDEIVQALLTTDATIRGLAAQLHVGYSTIAAIYAAATTHAQREAARVRKHKANYERIMAERAALPKMPEPPKVECRGGHNNPIRCRDNPEEVAARKAAVDAERMKRYRPHIGGEDKPVSHVWI